MSYDTAKQVLYDSWIGENGFNGDSKKCWEWVNSRKLSQGETRHEVGLNTANTVFTFAVTNTDQNSDGLIFKTERRLRLQDSLIVSEYGILVAQTTGAVNDTAFKLHTYGNTTDFAAADAAALNTTFYSNGFFSMGVNNDTIIPYRGVVNHMYVPQTQQTAAAGPASPFDQYRGAEDGFITQEPNIYLIGSKGYVPTITLAGALASAATGVRAILIFRGILAQNSTVIN